MVIPALSIIAVVFYGISKSIEVSTKVIYRDSFALIILLIALIGIFFIFSNVKLDRWFDISFFLRCLYILYVLYNGEPNLKSEFEIDFPVISFF